MDLWIPETGGAYAIQCLKGDEATKNIVTILFSASVDVIEKSRECGADGYIIKPFNIIDFKQMIHSFITKGK